MFNDKMNQFEVKKAAQILSIHFVLSQILPCFVSQWFQPLNLFVR